jgi:hypothetical protein
MARTCPNCGTKAIDDQSAFCNKCGTPFPADPPKKVVVRTTPRLAETPPPPQQPLAPLPPVEETPVARQPRPASPPARSLADLPRVRAPQRRPAREKTVKGGFFNFGTLITQKFIRLIYIAGMIAIILISLMGILSAFSQPAASTATEAGAVNATASGHDSTTSLISWVIFLVIGNIFWRILCEMAFVLFSMNDSLNAIKDSLAGDQDALLQDGPLAYDGGRPDEFVDCPRCGKVVPAGELRTCEHCGVQGCSSCIRQMGLLKKTLTCKDCYQRK